MRLSMSGAMQTKQKNRCVYGFSKSYEPGDTTRAFYPIFWDDDGVPQLCVGVACGHSVHDWKALGKIATFIPTLSPLDSDYNPIQHDITYKFAKSVAPAIFAGQFKERENMINSKNWPSDEAKRMALKELEYDFDSKSNMKAVKPIISGYQMLILTEPLVCKVANGKVNADTQSTYIQKVSTDLYNKLTLLMNDPKYAPAPGSTYFEVEYVYPAGQDKTQAGRTVPSGLTKEFRLCNSDPDTFSKLSQYINGLTTDADVISAHFAKPVEESRIIQSLTNYTFMNSQYLDLLSPSSDSVKGILGVPDLIMELQLVNSISNEELAVALKEATEMNAAKEPVQNPNDVLSAMAASMTSEAPITDEQSAPTLSDLISNTNAIMDVDTLAMMELETVDLNV